MAITRDNPQLLFAGAEGTGSHTASYTVGASVTYLIVGIAEWDGTNITDTAVTFNGVTMTPLQRLHEVTGDNNVMLFGLVSPATGAHNVVVSRPGNNLADITIGAVGYIGVDTSTPTGTVVTATGSNTTPGVTVTSATGQTDVAAVAYDRAFSSRGGGQTQLWRDETDEHGLADDKAGAASNAFTWTMDTTGGWGVIGVPLKPTGGTDATVTAPKGAATATGLVPSLISSPSIAAPAGTATGAGLVPSLTLTASVAAPVAAASAVGLVPSVSLFASVTAPLGTASGAGLAPSIALSASITAPVGTATAVGLVPSVTTAASQTVTAPLGIATAAGLTPSLLVDASVSAPLGTSTAVGLVPSVVVGILISAPVGTCVAVGKRPTLFVDGVQVGAVGEAWPSIALSADLITEISFRTEI